MSFIQFCFYSFSEKCGSDNIFENEMAENMTDNQDDIAMDIESELTASDNSRPPSSCGTSRPNSSLNQSFDSQEVKLLNSIPMSMSDRLTEFANIFQFQSSSDFRSQTPTAKQTKLKRYMDDMKSDEKEKFDSLAALFFYGCNIPFRVSDSVHFKNFVKALRPAYTPPNRRALANQLLEKTHESIEKRKLQFISKTNKRATLLVDGWKNSSANRKYVAMMLATSDDEKVFLDAPDFSTLRETSVNLFEAVSKAVALAKERYDVDVYAVLTDNASNMQSMGASCESLKLLYSTCNAHSANLLAGDILKVAKYSKVLGKVMTVQKDFKRTGLVNRLLKAGGRKPVLSGNTRWVSQRDAADSFLKNLLAMKKVSAECDADVEIDEHAITPEPGVSALLYNAEFLSSVKELLEILNHVGELTNYCQKSSSSAADAAEKWLEIYDNGSAKMRSFVKARLKQSNVLNTVTMTANYLHPVYRGNRLSTDQRTIVTNYIFDKLEAAELESFRLFSKEDGDFAKLKQKNITSAKTYWHFAAELGHPKLAAFAMDYLKIPASTAQLERFFSEWGYVHSDTRNRLSDETSEKLIDIYFTLRCVDEIQEDDFESEMDG